MQKIQILYPDPQMKSLREAAKSLDRPISEIVREATAEWLKRWAPKNDAEVREAPPVYSAGTILIAAKDLRAAGQRDEQS